MAIRVNLEPLESTTAFPYLGRMVTFNNSDCSSLYINLRKAQRQWGVVAEVLGNTGVLVKAQAMMCKAVVQELILYGSEIWVVTKKIMTFLEVFHHGISRQIMGMKEWMGDGGEWEWNLVDAALEATGIWLMRDYLWRWKANIEEYVMGRPIYEMCIGEDMMEVSSRLIQW